MIAAKGHGRRFLVGAGITILVALVYWPVLRGGFVWDDKLCFHDAAWLRSGSAWTHYVFRDFCDWTSYFRPLAVAVLTVEVRVFDSAPGPMHAVSLALHLINLLLVGVLARTFLPHTAQESPWPAAMASLVYGLHPVLIEPVYWIGCQYEMLVTMFILLGLLASSLIEHKALRAIAVAFGFFFAACAKEAALAFPLLLILFDMTQGAQAKTAPTTWRALLLALWRRQHAVYLAVAVAGCVYLALRYWAIGLALHQGTAEALGPIARFQKIIQAYLDYWKLLVWPMTGLGPIHPYDDGQFSAINISSLVNTLSVAAIVGCGLYAFWKRDALGTLILAVSAALLPALHILPIAFSESLYHERYAMTALAVGCALLPATLCRHAGYLPQRWLWAPALLAAAWLALGVINIRVTLPLWSDELALWQWALREYPDSIVAKQHLLNKYVERNDRARAHELAYALISGNQQCPVCMLTIAYLALGEGDATLAATAVDRIRNAPALPDDPLFLQEYILVIGGLRELQGQPKAAEEAYRDAFAMAPLDPQPAKRLALLLLREGALEQARLYSNMALSLLAADERDAWRATFERALTAPAPHQ